MNISSISKFRLGFAKISFEQLQFEDYIRVDGSATLLRPIEASNVVRLAQIFRLEGVRREVAEHYIAAIAPSNSTPAFLAQQPDQPITTLSLPNGTTVKCLYGRHRIIAAKEVLDPDDRWWIVEVFRADTPADIAWQVASEYANAKNFSDGYIFRNLRKFDNNPEEKCWLARLSIVKQRDYKQLNQSHNAELLKALDKLLPYTGLWSKFLLGTFHRILSLRCVPELARYLCLVESVWYNVLEGLVEPSVLDSDTVDAIETMHPKLSIKDKGKIRKMMHNRTMFPAVNDSYKRDKLQERLFKVPYRIPTLYTFLEDTKYIEPCAKVMKSLISIKWQRKEQLEYKMKEMYGGKSFLRHYLELWIYAIRHFPEMTDAAPRKEAGKPKPVIKESSRHRWYEFADLAHSFKFESSCIRELRNSDVEHDMLLGFLEKIYPDVELDSVSGFVEAMQGLLRKFAPSINRPVSTPNYTTDLVDLALDHRCGRPFEDDFERDKKYLTVENVLRISFANRNDYVTSFSMLCSIFYAFFIYGEEETLALERSETNQAQSDQDLYHHADLPDAEANPRACNAEVPPVNIAVDGARPGKSLQGRMQGYEETQRRQEKRKHKRRKSKKAFHLGQMSGPAEANGEVQEALMEHMEVEETEGTPALAEAEYSVQEALSQNTGNEEREVTPNLTEAEGPVREALRQNTEIEQGEETIALVEAGHPVQEEQQDRLTRIFTLEEFPRTVQEGQNEQESTNEHESTNERNRQVVVGEVATQFMVGGAAGQALEESGSKTNVEGGSKKRTANECLDLELQREIPYSWLQMEDYDLAPKRNRHEERFDVAEARRRVRRATCGFLEYLSQAFGFADQTPSQVLIFHCENPRFICLGASDPKFQDYLQLYQRHCLSSDLHLWILDSGEFKFTKALDIAHDIGPRGGAPLIYFVTAASNIHLWRSVLRHFRFRPPQIVGKRTQFLDKWGLKMLAAFQPTQEEIDEIVTAKVNDQTHVSMRYVSNLEYLEHEITLDVEI